MDASMSPENEVLEERPFNAETDLCPLEKVLIAGSLIFPGKEGISYQEDLKTDANKDFRGDPDFLLRPSGLTTGESDIEGIKTRRSQRRNLRGWCPLFTFTRELHLGYIFDFYLNELDENGRIHNRFEFKFKNENSGVWDKANTEALKAFRTITLSPESATYAKGKPFFSLTKDEDEGILTLTFAPLLENIKQ